MGSLKPFLMENSLRAGSRQASRLTEGSSSNNVVFGGGNVVTICVLVKRLPAKMDRVKAWKKESLESNEDFKRKLQRLVQAKGWSTMVATGVDPSLLASGSRFVDVLFYWQRTTLNREFGIAYLPAKLLCSAVVVTIWENVRTRPIDRQEDLELETVGEAASRMVVQGVASCATLTIICRQPSGNRNIFVDKAEVIVSCQPGRLKRLVTGKDLA